MSEREFPVLINWQERHRLVSCPRSVPWAMLAPHEEQAHLNHDQTLERLAQRGGLGPEEMVAVLEDRRFTWRSLGSSKEADEANELAAVARLKMLIAKYRSA